MLIYELRWRPSWIFDWHTATAGLSLTLDPMGIFFQNASSLKPLGQLKPNYPGMIIGMSSTKCVFLCRSKIQDGHHRRTYINIGPYEFGFNYPSGFREEAF
jgi:hypothetical protein